MAEHGDVINKNIRMFSYIKQVFLLYRAINFIQRGTLANCTLKGFINRRFSVF